MSESPTRHIHLLHGYNFYKNPRARFVSRGVSFAPRTQNIEAKRYKIFSPGGDLAPGICVPLSHPTFYISIVPHKCVLPLGFPTKTLYAFDVQVTVHRDKFL